MKKEIAISIVILIGFISLLWLEKPLREFLSGVLPDKQFAEQIAGITVRIILIIITILLMKKFRLIEFSGLNNPKHFKNIQAIIISLAFILTGISGNWDNYINSDYTILSAFAISTLGVGILEEFVFRGTIFPLFIISFKNTNRPLLISAVLASLAFGLVHFINLFSQPENIAGIISQVFFATSIGVFFCGLMVRTENILIPCIIHALVNFSFGAGELKPPVEEIYNTAENPGTEWSSLIPTTIFFSFIFSGGIYMILKTEAKMILDKLKNVNPAIIPANERII